MMITEQSPPMSQTPGQEDRALIGEIDSRSSVFDPLRTNCDKTPRLPEKALFYEKTSYNLFGKGWGIIAEEIHNSTVGL